MRRWCDGFQNLINRRSFTIDQTLPTCNVKSLFDVVIKYAYFVPEGDLDVLDDLVKATFYANRADAIRNAIRDLVRGEKKLLKKKE